MTPDRAAERFVAEGRTLVSRVRALSGDARHRRIPIPRLTGLEHSSREWSPLMVIEHLLITGPGMLGAARLLDAGKVPNRTVSTADLKPAGGAGEELLERYETFLDGYRPIVAELRFPPEPRFPHPWFGPLDSRGWIVLNTIHQGIHRRQLAAILDRLPNACAQAL